MILAIDPGPEKSAYVYLDRELVLKSDIVSNDEMLSEIYISPVDAHLAIEMVACYGMPVGAEVFETCVWIGRFVQSWRHLYTSTPMLIKRATVKANLCGVTKAKDANVRQALIDRFSGGRGEKVAKGNKANPGPLYGISSHMWSALAVAVTCQEMRP